MSRLFAVLALCVTLTLAIDLKPYDDSARLYFTQFDADNDGQVSRTDFLSGFDVYDVDKNGVSSLDEFKVHIAHDHPQFIGYEEKMFKFNDFNQDGLVKLDDFELVFAQFDTNGDGILTMAEWMTQFPALLAVIEADLNNVQSDKEL